MRIFKISKSVGWFVLAAGLGLASAASAARTNTLRIVTYNIEDDTGTFTGTSGVPRPGLVTPSSSAPGDFTDAWMGGALEGIGEEPLGASNNVQPLDILALQQTTSNTISVDPIVNGLNAYYGVTTYASSPVQGTQQGSNVNGNGPNALVYNTAKLQLVNSVGVGTPLGATNGEYRQVMRYEFAPAGVTPSAANDFYIYVSNYKSGTTAADLAARNGEAQIIRNDSSTLPADAKILYVGSYNAASSSEAGYQTIVSAGTNQGVDPLNSSGTTGIDYTANSLMNSKTHSTQNLHYRDDLQAMTSNVYNFSPTAGGLQLIPNTYHAFGNDGGAPYLQSIQNSPTALSNLYATPIQAPYNSYYIDKYHLLDDLYSASDHLPVVADYTLGPGTSTWTGKAFKPQWGGLQGQAGTGSIANSNWDSQPIDGDNLVFTGSFTQNSNDYLTKVGSITFDNRAGAFTLSGNALTIAGGIANNSGQRQIVSLNLTLSAPQQFSSTTGVGPYSLIFNGAIDNGGNLLTLTVPVNGMKLAGTISGTGGLVMNQTFQSGGGYLISGNNSYSGGTTVNGALTTGAPTITLGSASALGTGGLSLNNATLWLNGFQITLTTLSGNGEIDPGLATSSVTVGSGDASGEFAGRITNGVAFIKVGAGTQILSGNNAFTSGTTISGGTLQAGSSNGLRFPGGVTVNGGGTLDLHGFGASTSALNGNGGMVQSNAAGAAVLNFYYGPADGNYQGTIADGLGTLSINKATTGTQIFSGNNTYSGGTTVTSGTLVAGSPTALGTGGLTIASSSGSTPVVRLQAGLSQAVALPSLTIDDGSAAPASSLDITDNSLIVRNGDLATLTAQVKSGLNSNGALWTGAGITSSTAAADGNVLTGVGIISNSLNGSPIYDTWPVGADSGGAVGVTNTDVLVKYTYFGDADLNGVVDSATDFLQWQTGFQSSGNLGGWLFGDFDYNGTVDSGTDFLLWQTSFQNQGGPLSGSVQPVPEPSTLVLAVLGLIGMATHFCHARRRTNTSC